MHSRSYRNVGSLQRGEVVVVGAGNTGVQIAQKLGKGGRRVSLSVSSQGKPLPNRLLGRGLFSWLVLLPAMDAGPETRIGRRLTTINRSWGPT